MVENYGTVIAVIIIIAVFLVVIGIIFWIKRSGKIQDRLSMRKKVKDIRESALSGADASKKIESLKQDSREKGITLRSVGTNEKELAILQKADYRKEIVGLWALIHSPELEKNIEDMYINKFKKLADEGKISLEELEINEGRIRKVIQNTLHTNGVRFEESA